MFVSTLLALSAAAPGQNADPLATTEAEPQSEMQKWIASLDAQWQAVFAREVTAQVEADQAKLWGQYLAAIESAITKATSAGNLELAVVWRNERERVGRAKDVPAEDEPGVPAELKQLRTGWRAQNAKINRDRAEHAKAVHARYDQVLAQAQTQLTQAQRIDDALLVKAKRDEISAAWLTSAQQGVPPVRTTAGLPKPATPKPSAFGKDMAASGVDVLPAKVAGAQKKDGFTVTSNPAWILSSRTFRPPVTITYVLKTNDQVRLRFAADQIIFNWESRKTELRIDGGPANGQHRKGSGAIPVNEVITIRQTVLPDKMTITVDGEERASWEADFSKVKQEVGIRAFEGSTVWVKQILVNQIR